MLENKTAVIFDLDGSLVDSMWMWHEIDLEFLGSRGIELPDDYQKKIEGMSFTETAVYSIERFSLDESVEELKQIWNGMAHDKYAHEVGFKPGALEFLEYCRQAGLKTAIATSNSMELVRAVSGSLQLDRYIDVIVTACEVSRGKPAPDVYLEAARRLSADPQDCFVFEDIPAGILSGKNAGMTVCAVEDASSAPYREEIRKLADYYITDYREALQPFAAIRSGCAPQANPLVREALQA